MRRAVLMVLGLGICSAAVVVGCLSLYQLGRIGTCASGGPYEIANECPPGTSRHALLLVVAVFAGFIGPAVYAVGARGVGGTVRLVWLMWALTFVGLAGAMGAAAFGPAAPDTGGGAQVAAIVLLVTFIPMGIAPLVFGSVFGSDEPKRRRARGGRRGAGAGDAISVAGLPDAPQSPPAAPARAAKPPARPRPAPEDGSDTLARLERLGALRSSGALSEEEFARLKRELLAE